MTFAEPFTMTIDGHTVGGDTSFDVLNPANETSTNSSIPPARRHASRFRLGPDHVDKVSLTGSTATRRRVMQSASITPEMRDARTGLQ